MSMFRVLMAAITAAGTFELALGVNYNVGAPNGRWDLNTNCTVWASGKEFYSGDTLEFIYGFFHSVLVVSKANYDSCTTADPISFNTGGNTTITLTDPGTTMYFICGTPGHCNRGLRLQIHVLESSNPPAPAISPGPSPTAPAAATSSLHMGAAFLVGFVTILLLAL